MLGLRMVIVEGLILGSRNQVFHAKEGGGIRGEISQQLKK